MKIDYVERLVTITHVVVDRLETFTGWAMLSTDGNSVTARKYRGRNRYSLCRISDIVSVDSYNPEN